MAKDCVGCGKEVKITSPRQSPHLCYDCWYLEVEKEWSGC